jgi:hypothetical protein
MVAFVDQGCLREVELVDHGLLGCSTFGTGSLRVWHLCIIVF